MTGVLNEYNDNINFKKYKKLKWKMTVLYPYHTNLFTDKIINI